MFKFETYQDQILRLDIAFSLYAKENTKGTVSWNIVNVTSALAFQGVET